VNIVLPHILEMTFVNKSLVLNNKSTFNRVLDLFKTGEKVSLDMGDYPTEQDRKNDLNRADHSLEFLKLINNL
jgi:hypothetical protein